MARLQQEYEQQGFYGIGLVNCVKGVNVGTLWRSAYILGASFIFTVGKPYKREAGDVTLTWQKIPLYHYASVDALKDHLPFDTRLVGVELSPEAHPLSLYDHPQRAVYLLGNEQVGLPPDLLSAPPSLLKAKSFLTMDDIRQTIEYLKTTKYEILYIVNFGENNFKPKRYIFTNDRKIFCNYTM